MRTVHEGLESDIVEQMPGELPLSVAAMDAGWSNYDPAEDSIYQPVPRKIVFTAAAFAAGTILIAAKQITRK